MWWTGVQFNFLISRWLSTSASGFDVQNIRPAGGSPSSCSCHRVLLSRPYSPGALLKCERCISVHKSTSSNSCPVGWKIFAPQSRSDWVSVIQANILHEVMAPDVIIDVTRPTNGCGGCEYAPMNSGDPTQHTWRTADGAPWWLRSTKYKEPNGDYQANCFLRLGDVVYANSITFNDIRCKAHSSSYFCQPKNMYAHLFQGLSFTTTTTTALVVASLDIHNVTPALGSPVTCMCQHVLLNRPYSAGALLKCVDCIEVYRSSSRNSCPVGWKIFSPRSKHDWQAIIDSGTLSDVRSPHIVIDITRPRHGCGGCARSAMNSNTPEQSTWRTSDGSPWWLRSSKYKEPNADYFANCFLEIILAQNADNIKFNDYNCNGHSTNYLCQPQALFSHLFHNVVFITTTTTTNDLNGTGTGSNIGAVVGVIVATCVMAGGVLVLFFHIWRRRKRTSLADVAARQLTTSVAPAAGHVTGQLVGSPDLEDNPCSMDDNVIHGSTPVHGVAIVDAQGAGVAVAGVVMGMPVTPPVTGQKTDH